VTDWTNGLTDDQLEEIFGPPQVAAADLHELRVWGHSRTALTPNAASTIGRDICMRTDPTWPGRALTNDQIILPPGRRPRNRSMRVKLAESTVETMLSVADGKSPLAPAERRSNALELLWPAQSCGWLTWVMQIADLSAPRRPDIADELTAMRRHTTPFSAKPYLHPARLMMAVRDGGSGYVDAVAAAVASEVPTRSMWKFGCLPLPEPAGLLLEGLVGFGSEGWLDLFPDGELALWLRSAVVCGWMTSHQIAWTMGVESARSCKEGWV